MRMILGLDQPFDRATWQGRVKIRAWPKAVDYFCFVPPGEDMQAVIDDMEIAFAAMIAIDPTVIVHELKGKEWS